ncbi:MAG: 30S ribosomal protein S12 methylthiotransferase RimO [Tepidiformaceae bacterium]
MSTPKTYHLMTLGCPKNDVDSEHFERMLTGGNLTPVDDPEGADAIIVNTCGFIEQSQAQSMEAVEELVAGKRAGQTLIVAGCMTQLYGRDVKERFPGVDHVFGVGQWGQVAGLLSVDVDAIYDIPDTPAKVTGGSAYLKISDGCDAPCTFCVIPKIKGGLRSAPAGMLVKEAQRLVEAGAKELVLVAQDSTAWGEDMGLPVASGLPGLLEMLSEAAPDAWIRLMYAYPSRVSSKLIETMARLPNVVPYLDVPLQHGSEATLRRMKRPHNLEKVHGFIAELRAAMPDVVLRTSLIVGFPGETEEEFEEMVAFVRAIEFDHVGVFTYSRQQWTGAFEMAEQVPDAVKHDRRDRLMKIQQKIAGKRAQRFVGRDLEMLVEGMGEDEDGEPVIAGRTYREAPEVDGLVIAYGEAAPGSKVKVRIDAAEGYDLFGRVLRPRRSAAVTRRR